MRLAFLSSVLLGSACLGLVAGCGESASPGFEGGAGGAATPQQVSEIVFSPPQTLLLEPGAEAPVSVRVDPPGQYRVDFAVVAANREPFDGFLEQGSVASDTNGRATTVLHAPTRAQAFLVRASVGEFTATRAVSVSADGFARVRITPEYSGARVFSGWIASAYTGVTCTELSSLWEDGPLTATGDSELLIDGVPVGSVVSVVVRQARAVGGCLTLPELKADSTTDVSVEATDRPIQLTDTRLHLSFDIDTTTPEFASRLSQAVDSSLAQFANSTADDGQLLVDEIQDQIDLAADAAAFSENSATHGFADIVAGVIGKTALRDTAAELLFDAAGSIAGPDALVGVLESKSDGHRFLVESARDVPAALSGFLGSAIWNLERQPEDGLILSGPVSFSTPRWIVAIAESRTTQDPPLTPAQRLKSASNCEAVGPALTSAAGGDIFPGCDSDCARSLCASAVSTAWERARDAGSELSTLRLGASPRVVVDEDAVPATLKGTWLGSYKDEEAASAAGKMDGKALD